MQSLLDRPSLLFLLILVIVLLFGYKRLPDAARGIGRSLRVFKAETESLRTDGSAPTDASATTGAPVAPAAPIEAAPAPAPAAPPAAPAPAPAPASAPRYLVDPVTGEQILAQPVTPPADGAPRS